MVGSLPRSEARPRKAYDEQNLHRHEIAQAELPAQSMAAAGIGTVSIRLGHFSPSTCSEEWVPNRWPGISSFEG